MEGSHEEVRAQVLAALQEVGEDVTDVERDWLSEANIDIYLGIREPGAAVQMLCKTCCWRIQRRDLLTSLECPRCLEDALSHDAREFGLDPDGDVVFMNCFALPREISPDGVCDHMACLFERCLKKYPSPERGHLKWTWIIDTHGFSLLRYSNPKTSVKLLNLLQSIYPDRLKRLLIVDVPTIFWGFYKMIERFIDPVTASKIQFIKWEDAQAMFQKHLGHEMAARLYAEGLTYRASDAWQSKQWTTFYGPGTEV